ncbi:F-box protein CPR1-like isoform X4 [Tripterygium wilfordii]|uniref:F-box protein CPR1-like isoform X4 n=1 Tax=Tripterygium wilfordii TaxID=458696 RepID=UPI0018F8514D|nr:F-box protein CPR1-like isoform X4 [Tripterygium wilfordii]
MSSDLPREIIMEILIRLLVKPLLRFRCVSMSWYAMIDSKNFINRHVKHSIETTTNHHVILEDWKIETVGCPTTIFSASIDEGLGGPLKVMSTPLSCRSETLYSDSCNGLIFVCNSFEAIALWNPFTRRYRKIPTMPYEPSKIYLEGQPIFGFGYDNAHDDYKIVRIMRFHPKESMKAHEDEVQVYSLRTNTWRRVQDFPHAECLFVSGCGAFASGASHWMVYMPTGNLDDMDVATNNLDDKDAYRLVAFDYVKEEFQVLPQPEYTKMFDHNIIVALIGCVCLASNIYVQDGSYTAVHEMKRYGLRDSWNKSCTVKEADIDMPCEIGNAKPLMYSKGGDKMLLEVAYGKGFRSLIWYDLLEKKGSTVEIPDIPCRFTPVVCLESLVRLGEDDEFDGVYC